MNRNQGSGLSIDILLLYQFGVLQEVKIARIKKDPIFLYNVSYGLF